MPFYYGTGLVPGSDPETELLEIGLDFQMIMGAL